MGGEVGGRASALRGGAEVLGKGVSLCGGERRPSAGNASRSLRVCIGAAWACIGAAGACGSAREGRVAVWGRAEVFGGEWVVRSAGLTHIRRSSTRARVLLYIRPPCPRREIAAMGPKDAPASTHRPRRLSHPPRPRLHFRARVHTSPVCVCTSPSAFTLLPHRLPRPPQSNRHPAAAVIHNGLSTEKLSTSLLAALCKTFSPSRLRTRIYNYRSPVGRSRGVSAPLCPRVPRRRAQGGGGRRQRRTPPRAVPNHAACVSNHCAQRRKCTRPTPPLPVRTPRVSPPTAEPLPAYGRITVRKVRSAQGQPRPCPCVLPAAACLRPHPRPLMGEAPCAGWGRAKAKADAPSHSNPPLPCVLPAPACLPPRPRRLNGHPASAGGRENDRMAHRRTTTPTHRTQRGNDTCTIRVPRRKGAQSVVHNLYFSSSRPASFCTTFPQSCTDRPATCRKEHKWPLEGLIFRVLPPAFPPFPPKAIVQNTPAPPPFSPRKTPRFAPTRNRARTLASAERDNTPRPAHSSRFQRDTNESAAR